MGWSCRQDAGRVMDVWTAACVAQTGSQNTYTMKGAEFFWEVSRTEHADGAITGSILKTVRKPTVDELAKEPYLAGWSVRAGTFRIEGDGTVARAPKFLKDVAKRACLCGCRALDAAKCLGMAGHG